MHGGNTFWYNTIDMKNSKLDLIRRYIIIEWIFGLVAFIFIVLNHYYRVEEPTIQKIILIIPFVFIIGGIVTRIARKRLLKNQ